MQALKLSKPHISGLWRQRAFLSSVKTEAAAARATVRQRTFRRRQRLGLMAVTVEADSAIVDLLIRLQWLCEADSASKEAIGRAIERMLADAAQR